MIIGSTRFLARAKVLAVMFSVTLAGVGVRATPDLMSAARVGVAGRNGAAWDVVRAGGAPPLAHKANEL
jgi:hypothetical protein